jgi:hypothetical protein
MIVLFIILFKDKALSAPLVIALISSFSLSFLLINHLHIGLRGLLPFFVKKLKDNDDHYILNIFISSIIIIYLLLLFIIIIIYYYYYL